MTYPTQVPQIVSAQVSAFIKSFDLGTSDHEPEDGSMILVDETLVYVRTDQPEPRGFYEPGYPHTQEPTERIGDWWLLDGTEDAPGPFQLSEILGYDEPPEDRKVLHFELLVTPTDMARWATATAEWKRGHAEQRADSAATPIPLVLAEFLRFLSVRDAVPDDFTFTLGQLRQEIADFAAATEPEGGESQ